MKSPNTPGPGHYPNNLFKKETIEVESGMMLRMEFTHFEIWVGFDINTCFADWLNITDGDGTTLMNNSCGHASLHPSSAFHFTPPTIISRSNRVEVLFFTNEDGNSETGTSSYSGWTLRWSAVTPGECQQHVWIFDDFSEHNCY